MAAIKQLAAVARSGIGKGAARSVRREGRVPAVVYGGGLKPEPISVDYKDVNKLIYSGHFLTSIFELEVDGRRERVLFDATLAAVRRNARHACCSARQKCDGGRTTASSGRFDLPSRSCSDRLSSL